MSVAAEAPDALLAAGASASSDSGRSWARLRTDRGAMFALVFLALLCTIAAAANWIAPADPTRIDVHRALERPSVEYLLGTDDLGRDVLSRMIFGARVSLRASLQVVLGALLLALPIGLVSGYFGGRTDSLIMRSMDALMSLPPLILALAIAGVLGPGLTNTMIAISIVLVPSFARLIRGQTLAVREEVFVEASISIGSPTGWILRRRILPNVASPLLVQASIALGTALIVEASLSFLGLGIQPPQPSWGSMLRRAYDDVFVAGWLLFIPGAAIAATVLAFNALGEGLRDALALDGSSKRSSGRLGLTSAPASEPKTRLKPDSRPTSDEPEVVLDVRGVCVEFDTPTGPQRVVDDISFRIRRGRTLGLVGESGSGKTVTALSIMRLIASPPGRIVAGSVRLRDTELLDLSLAQMRALRGNRVAMVFQDAMTSLNPALNIGNQLIEAIRLHSDSRRDAAAQRAIELLRRVQIPDPEHRMRDYPHQLSGGMRQRVMIAMALAGEPDLLIADEPTTALDVTVQAQILALLRELQDELGLAMLFVTHDLGVIAQICDEVCVCYAGQIVEHADIATLFRQPQHPYTEGLLAAMPRLDAEARGRNRDEPLYGIPGNVPPPQRMPSGCRFHPRCPHVTDRCRSEQTPLVELDRGQQTRCLRHDELELQGAG